MNAAATPVAGSAGYVQSLGVLSRTNVNGLALDLSMENSGVNLTAGHAANSMKVTVYYVLEAV